MPVDYGLRILIAEDVPAVRSILRNMLEELGFSQIFEAEDGDLAWQMLQESFSGSESDPSARIGLVVADWQMPGMTGIDLLRAVRSSNAMRDMPFIMVTARGAEENIREATRAGVTDYLVKPFSCDQLAEKLEALFSRDGGH